MTADSYIKVLQDYLFDIMEDLRVNDLGIIFQQDNDPQGT